MALWSQLGINYGHQISLGYSTSQIDSDLTTLYALGFRKLRIAYPTFSDSTTITNCKDIITRALAKGFYVMWGVTASDGHPVTATIWGNFKTYVSGTLAPYAQALNNANFELAIGNEEEAHADGSTLTAATVRTDIRSLCLTVKGTYTVGKVSYSAQTNQIANWNSGGTGTLDYICFNGYDTLANFTANIKSIRANFGIKAKITEFGYQSNGITDYTTEADWYVDFVGRLQALETWSIPEAYLFTYRDGGFGLPADVSAQLLSTNVYRSTWPVAIGGRISVIS